MNIFMLIMLLTEEEFSLAWTWSLGGALRSGACTHACQPASPQVEIRALIQATIVCLASAEPAYTAGLILAGGLRSACAHAS